MMRHVAIVLALAVFVALGTWVAGWWAVPICGALAGFALGPGARPGRLAAAGAILAWAAILVGYRVVGFPIDVLTWRLAGAMRLPEWALITIALVFPALLASTSAMLGGYVRGAVTRTTASRGT